MNQYYTLGKISKITGINKETLKYYSKIGLFTPEIKDKNGYRYYSYQQFWRLDIIMTLRGVDFSINEIKNILALYDNREVLRKLRLQRKKLIQNRNKIDIEIKNINSLIKQTIESSRRLNENIEVKDLEEQSVLCVNLKERLSHLYILSILGDSYNQYCGGKKYGYELDCESLEKGEIYITKEYLMLEEVPSDIYNKSYQYVIPKGKYLCIEKHLNSDNLISEKDFSLLFKFAEENNFSIEKLFIDDIILQFVESYDFICTIKALVKEK